MSREYIIREYDERGNNIYSRTPCGGIEEWREYDENNNLIYCKYFDGNISQYWYDNDNLIYHNKKDYPNNEYWSKYDSENSRIKITKQEYENIKIKEYNSRTKCSRFELMEI